MVASGLRSVVCLEFWGRRVGLNVPPLPTPGAIIRQKQKAKSKPSVWIQCLSLCVIASCLRTCACWLTFGMGLNRWRRRPFLGFCPVIRSIRLDVHAPRKWPPWIDSHTINTVHTPQPIAQAVPDRSTRLQASSSPSRPRRARVCPNATSVPAPPPTPAPPRTPPPLLPRRPRLRLPPIQTPPAATPRHRDDEERPRPLDP